MNELSEHMSCDASNITGLIDRLEASKFIERTLDKNDRRVKLIRLTAAGEQAHREILEGLSVGERVNFRNLSDEELRTFSHLLDKLKP